MAGLHRGTSRHQQALQLRRRRLGGVTCPQARLRPPTAGARRPPSRLPRCRTASPPAMRPRLFTSSRGRQPSRLSPRTSPPPWRVCAAAPPVAAATLCASLPRSARRPR
eukprot:2418332-Pleurochrysis_carterae.AAC.1